MATLCLHWDTPDDADRRSALDTADRFCERAVRPLGERPEIPPTAHQMAALIAAADDAGLLPQPELPGLGLWSGLSAEALLLSADILARVAEHSAAAAYHLHQTALGRRLAARLGLDRAAALPCLYAAAGFAKGAVGSVLAGMPGGSVPAAAFPGSQAAGGTSLPQLWYAAEPWDAVLVPRGSDGASIGWALAERSTLSPVESPRSHGLEGVSLWALSIPEPLAPLAAARPLELYREMLACDALGLVATGLGAARGALTAAYRYAHERRQGGKLIYEHAAVRLLLGGADADAMVVEALLKQMCAAPRNLRNVFLLRSAAHPLLCRAATSALQVFGGYGYMRDFGLERALRDNNALRLCAGTPTDLVLTALEMESAA